MDKMLGIDGINTCPLCGYPKIELTSLYQGRTRTMLHLKCPGCGSYFRVPSKIWAQRPYIKQLEDKINEIVTTAGAA